MIAPDVEADLTTSAGLTVYLAPTKYAAADVQALTGGTVGFTYRVTLKNPEAGGEKSVVVKHSLGYAARIKDLELSPERMAFEHEALEVIAQSGLFTPQSTVQVPRVLHYDSETYTLIMTDLVKARALSSVLIEAFEAGTIQSVSTQIGAAIGDFMGRFHNWGSQPEQEGLRNRFLDNTASREAVLELRYRLMTKTAENLGMKEEWMGEMVKEGMSDAAKGGSVIAMADFWFENILVVTEPKLRIYIIDWETVRCARPELDVAQFVTDAYSIAHIHPNNLSDFRLVQSFMQSYNRYFVVDEVQIALSGGRDVMGFGVGMPWIRHLEDNVKGDIARCGLELLEVARKGDIRGIKQNMAVRDMYS